MKKYQLTRSTVLDKAIHDCLSEMYRRAQPSADFDDYVKQLKDGTITDKTRPYIYERHYLSEEESNYIIEKYRDAYRISNDWASNLDILLKDLREGCSVNKYVPAKVDPETGFKTPGYRDYEHRDSLEERLKDILGDEDAAKKAAVEVFDYIENRQGYYRFDRELQQFNNTIYLGCSPTTNKETVKEYWKSQGQDIEIVDRDPRSFWYVDEGWSEEEIREEMEELDTLEKNMKKTNEDIKTKN